MASIPHSAEKDIESSASSTDMLDTMNFPASKPESQAIEDNSTPPPPAKDEEGTLLAWSQVLMSHLVSFNAWGYLNSFGLFQAYYTTTLLPSVTPSTISWIGSVQILLSFLVGSVSGRALDAGYLRHVLFLGSVLQLVGIMTTSVSSKYWHLLLAQGICKGLGDGLMFCPAVAVVPTYFVKRRRALAMSLAASGTATGGMVFPVMARELMPRIGFAWTVRAMGLVVLVNAVVILALARAKPAGTEKRPWFEWRAFREREYALFCVGMFLNWWALYFAFFYISAFAKTQLNIDTSTSLVLLLLINAVGLPGRIVFGLLSDRFLGPLRTLIPVALCTSILFYSWAAVHSLSGLYAFCALYGFFGSAIQGLFPASCASLTTDLRTIGARTGMCFAVVSIAALTGSPIGGALVQLHGRYLDAQMFGGSSLLAGSAALVAAYWVSVSRRKVDV
ncbi:MFS general substrate transporter [Echria macrotheca]|uniref:MFS general substrate transporter n=1 Tax=Echria macrotheca TaxID=438768 RepID=A0AAJ0BCS3_9PEZI|nr:MFS general substrate transporter [Echria macrotheca]